MHKINLLFAVFLFPLLVQAQIPQKFGKITPAELDLKVYSKDSSAAAVVLFDKGETYYDFSNVTYSFRVVFKEHKRIKILKKEGLDEANIKINTYGGANENSEKITSFKAFTYNVENGTAVKTKLDKNQIFKEKVTDRVTATKFAFPNVKEGSIIEYEIEIESGYNMNINDWAFQDNIPTCWSEYTVSIPEYFKFNKHTKGYEPFKTIEKTTQSKSISINGNSLMYSDYTDHFVMENVPAFKTESNIDCVRNYLSMVTYEISSFEVPGSKYENYNTTWPKIAENMLDNEDFGGQLKTRGFFKEDLAAAIKTDTSATQKLNSIFNLVKSKIKWNDINSKWTKDGIKKAYKAGIGNSAEINLLLVAMLQEAGSQAYPVGISTRSNGLLTFGNPSTNKMNYVIGVAYVNEKEILLDATSPVSIPGIIPFQCLNDKGFIIDKNLHEWVELTPTAPSKENHFVFITVGTDGTVSGKISSNSSDNDALYARDKYRIMKDDELKKMLTSKLGDATVDSVNVENLLTNLNKPVAIKFQYSIPSKAAVTDKNIFITPFIWDKYTNSPFKLEKRTYPINFGYPTQERYISSISIPEGYTVEEIPQNIAVGTSDKSATLIVSYTKTENQVNVSFMLNINKPIFISTEYEELKEIYNLVVQKQAEQIVLKKI